nr:venom polypeptide precursor [Doratifera vulnerans]
MVPLKLLLCAALFAVASSTEVRQCRGQSTEGLTDAVTLSSCKVPPCRLKKGKNQRVQITFTPEKNMNDVVAHVTANVLGADLPFVGVDGISICNKIEKEDGTKASCPLQAGTKYVYKDSFPVLEFYPSIHVDVHWALQHNKKDIICFEVPADIQ